MEVKLTKAAQGMLDRVMKLHNSGLSTEEISTRIFTPDMETIKFCIQGMVEIIIEYGNRYAEGKKECKKSTKIHS